MIEIENKTKPSGPSHKEEIELNGWNVTSTTSTIAGIAEEEALSSELGIKLPGMLFLRNELLVEKSSSFSLRFKTLDALRGIGKVNPEIQVAAAERWKNARDRTDIEVGLVESASDWTFTTEYNGTLNSSLVPTEKSIDYDLLRDTTLPIRFSSSVILFEDELDDNGISSYKVRIRVMPSCFFILARFFLRVDGVIIKVHDTRFFHKFGDNVVVRERQTRQADLKNQMMEINPVILRDPELVVAHVPVTETYVDNLNCHSS